MLHYFLKRLLGLLPTLFLVAVIVFLFVHMLPGDPARLAAGPEADQVTVELVRKDLGLDKPLPEQFITYFGNIITKGDFGTSLRTKRPVSVEIGERFAATFWLTVWSMVWSVFFGLIIGMISATKRNKWQDHAGMALAVSGISFPTFALGLLLMEIFSVSLGWLPTVGADSWKHYILPSITLGAGVAAVMARFTRASFVEILQDDYIRTARAKGLSEWAVIVKHGLRNALIPVVTMMGLQFGFLLGGSIVVEKVFNWPGLGRLLVDAVEMRDYPVLQAEVLLFSLEFISSMPSSTHESASSDMSMQNNVSVASGPTKVRTPWSEFWRKFKRQRMTLFAGSFIGLLVLIAIFWPWLVPYDPENYFDYDMLNAGPSLQHWFGVDSLGRDIFSRILAGARISLTAGFSSVLVGAVVGTLLGLTSGYFEGWWDRVVMRVCDVLFAFPGILLAISVVAVLGSGMANVILAVAIFSIPAFARLVRGNTLSLKRQTFVEAARSLGAGPMTIMLRHIFPGTISSIVVYFSMRIGTSIITAASLSFLGLGAQPPTPEWGAMLNEARADMVVAPHVAIFPSLAIFLTVLMFNLFGDGLRDALDPKIDQE